MEEIPKINHFPTVLGKMNLTPSVKKKSTQLKFCKKLWWETERFCCHPIIHCPKYKVPPEGLKIQIRNRVNIRGGGVGGITGRLHSI